MGATHDQNITINITLDAAPAEETGFGTVLGIVPKASNSLNGSSIVTYTSTADAQTDRTAGYISAATLAAVTTMFSQVPKPAQVKIAWIDLVAPETYSAALARIRALDDDFYGVWIGERTDAAILAIAAAIEGTRKICAVQSDDGGFLTGTYPAGLAALAGYDRTLVCYHDDDAEHMDAALLANRLVYDPDVISCAWGAPLSGVDATAGISDAERNYAIANDVNIGLPYGGETFYVDPGVAGSGRPMYEVVTADWFHARLLEDVATEKINHAARGAKLTLDERGQTKIKSLIDARGAQGLSGGSPHFLDFESAAVTLTDADRTAQRMRFTARAQLAVSGRIFQFDLNFSRDELA